jgi:hypothetical protein
VEGGAEFGAVEAKDTRLIGLKFYGLGLTRLKAEVDVVAGEGKAVRGIVGPLKLVMPDVVALPISMCSGVMERMTVIDFDILPLRTTFPRRFDRG